MGRARLVSVLLATTGLALGLALWGCGGQTPTPRGSGLGTSSLTPTRSTSGEPGMESRAPMERLPSSGNDLATFAFVPDDAKDEALRQQYGQARILVVSSADASLVERVRKA